MFFCAINYGQTTFYNKKIHLVNVDLFQTKFKADFKLNKTITECILIFIIFIYLYRLRILVNYFIFFKPKSSFITAEIFKDTKLNIIS